jgi:predicted metal-dependent hydrolase
VPIIGTTEARRVHAAIPLPRSNRGPSGRRSHAVFLDAADRAPFGSTHLPRGLRAALPDAYLYSYRCQDFGVARCAARVRAGKPRRLPGRPKARRTANMKSAACAAAADVMPVRRDLRFDLPVERAKDWHGLGPHVTHFFNALSLLFPAGERFFMDSVRNYRDRIDDPVLKRQVLGFIGQEAMHTREHVEYNELMQANRLPARKLDKRVWTVLGFLKRKLPHSVQLAHTVAAEHYTAMLADWILRDPTRLAGSVEGYRQMWVWHALEETEHKAVSYDVWNAVTKPGLRSYLIRIGVYLATTLTFWPTVFLMHVTLLSRDRAIKHRARGMLRMVAFLYGPRRGLFPRIAGEWLSFFRPGFHPWDHDNRHHLARVDALVAAYGEHDGAPAGRGRANGLAPLAAGR